MLEIQGLYWPENVGEKYKHAFMHVGSIEWSIRHCRQHRTAVQAGGNVGLWPRRLAEVFKRVITFEPEPETLACLRKNVPPSVEVRAEALGDQPGRCSVIRKSLGSHRVFFANDANMIPMTTVDALGLTDLDFLQLDIEGYEWHALHGAMETIARCQPLIQLEFRNQTNKYAQSDDTVRALLGTLGYRLLSKQQGSDEVYGPTA